MVSSKAAPSGTQDREVVTSMGRKDGRTAWGGGLVTRGEGIKMQTELKGTTTLSVLGRHVSYKTQHFKGDGR